MYNPLDIIQMTSRFKKKKNKTFFMTILRTALDDSLFIYTYRLTLKMNISNMKHKLLEMIKTTKN